MKITVTVVAALALALALAHAGPASAEIAGLQLVGANSAYDSFNKQKIVACQGGRQVIGAAGHIEAPLGLAVMDDMTPASNLSAVGVTAFEDSWGIQQNWDLTAYAICAHPPAGLVRVVATSPVNSEDKSVTAKCPVGKKVLGTGGDIVAPVSVGGQVGLVEIETDSELADVTVKGAEDHYLYDDWSVRAYAICAPAPVGLSLHGSPPVGSEQPAMASFATAYCPKGKRVLGVGGRVGPTPWSPDWDWTVTMPSIAPDENLKSVTVIGAKKPSAQKLPPKVDAHAQAICAPADWTPGGWSPSHG